MIIIEISSASDKVVHLDTGRLTHSRAIFSATGNSNIFISG